jgi:hypothetical protein
MTNADVYREDEINDGTNYGRDWMHTIQKKRAEFEMKKELKK